MHVCIASIASIQGEITLQSAKSLYHTTPQFIRSQKIYLFIYLFYCAEINIDYSAQILLLKLLQKFSKEDESTTKPGRRFHSLITDGKNEYLYESMFVVNCLQCPLLSRESFGMKRSLGTSTRSLTILYIIISLALSLHCFNGGKLNELSMSVTL